MFAKTKSFKSTCSIKYIVEEAWGMVPKYVPCLIKQLRKVVTGSDADNDIMETMLSVPAMDESGEKFHVSVY